MGQAAYKTMVTIATFNEQSKAKHLRDRLGQAGIGADIIGDSHLQRVAFMAKPRANVKVKVNEDDFGKAHQLMREWEVSILTRRRAALPTMRIFQYRISANDPEISDPGDREHSLCSEDFSERILLSQLPLYLDERAEGQISRLWHMIFPGTNPYREE